MLSFLATKASLKVGKTATIVVKSKFPTNDTVKSYKSSNAKVATVSSKGVVTAKAEGVAIISVISLDGEKSATCKVSVQAESAGTISVTGVSTVL